MMKTGARVLAEREKLGSIEVFLKSLIGETATKVFLFLLGKSSEATDEEIANGLNMKTNAVRKALYTLVDYNLVSYRRVRDSRSGWYTYYWKANENQVLSMIISRKKLVLEKLRTRLEFESNSTFYQCSMDGSRYSFNEALEYNFTCPRCGNPLVYIDNTSILQALRDIIRRIEEELKSEESRAYSG